MRGRTLVTLCLTLVCALNIFASGAKLPEIQTVTLKNGLTVHLMPAGKIPLVNMRLMIPLGSTQDPMGKEGLAAMTMDLLQEGTTNRSAEEIALLVDGWGANLSSYASTEEMGMSTQVLSEYTGDALALLADLVKNPSFKEKDFTRVRDLTLAQLKAMRDQPEAMAGRALTQLLYQDHALGRPQSGSLTSVATIERKDILGFHKTVLGPAQAHLILVGDVNSAKIMKLVKKHFSGWKGEAFSAAPLKAPKPATKARFVLVHKPDSTQAQIRKGHLSIGFDHDLFIPLRLVNTPFGGSFTSWLNDEIRVKRGLSYGAGSRHRTNTNGGHLYVSTFTRNEKLPETLDVINELTGKLVKDGLKPGEIKSAKAYIAGLYPTGGTLGPGLMEFSDLASLVVTMIRYDLSPETMNGRLDKLLGTTKDQIKAAEKLYDPGHDLLLVVGDKTVLLPLLGDKYGEITVLEMDDIK